MSISFPEVQTERGREKLQGCSGMALQGQGKVLMMVGREPGREGRVLIQIKISLSPLFPGLTNLHAPLEYRGPMETGV